MTNGGVSVFFHPRICFCTLKQHISHPDEFQCTFEDQWERKDRCSTVSPAVRDKHNVTLAVVAMISGVVEG